MILYILKIAVSAALIVVIAEISRRNSFFAAFVASLPVISILAIIWLYIDTKDIGRVIALTTGILWLVLPSLTFFISLPLFLKHGWNFYFGLIISILLTSGSYWLMITILHRLGIKL